MRANQILLRYTSTGVRWLCGGYRHFLFSIAANGCVNEIEFIRTLGNGSPIFAVFNGEELPHGKGYRRRRNTPSKKGVCEGLHLANPLRNMI